MGQPRITCTEQWKKRASISKNRGGAEAHRQEMMKIARRLCRCTAPHIGVYENIIIKIIDAYTIVAYDLC